MKARIKYISWAGILTCPFLCFVCSLSFAQEWTFNPRAKFAYDQVLNLQVEEVLQFLQDPKTAQEKYVVSLAHAVELLTTEDGEKYESYHDTYESFLGKRSKSSLAEDLFLQAELRLHWAFVYLKFGHEFDAAWNLREAYLSIKDCKEQYPDFKAINKSSGLIKVLIGSVPEKYKWVLNLMGMEGSVAQGLAELESLRTNHALSLEANIIHATLQSYVFQHTEEGYQEIKTLLSQAPDNRLLNLVGAGLCIKNSKADEALTMLIKLEKLDQGIPLTFSYYLKGEVYLQKGEYRDAISAYRWFVRNFKGQDNIKDAYYKMGVAYLLNGYTNDAIHTFDEAKSKGRESSEADKYAARMLASKELPNIPLSKTRYFTDGGYYSSAKMILDSIRSTEIPNHKDQVEYYYRKARLAHKMLELNEAKKFYLEAINLTTYEDSYYFAPNSCLQIGYILISQKNITEANAYFRRALEYDKHEYKSSIESKAKTAMAQLSVMTSSE